MEEVEETNSQRKAVENENDKDAHRGMDGPSPSRVRGFLFSIPISS